MDELDFEDLSSDGLVLYQLAALPEFGVLMYQEERLSIADGFTQPDVDAGYIR